MNDEIYTYLIFCIIVLICISTKIHVFILLFTLLFILIIVYVVKYLMDNNLFKCNFIEKFSNTKEEKKIQKQNKQFINDYIENPNVDYITYQTGGEENNGVLH